MKNSLKKAFSVIAMAAVAVSASSAVVSAAEEEYKADGGYTAAQIAASTVQPKVDVTKIVVSPDKAGQQVEVKINLKGANAKYCSTGMHFYYDERLQIEKDPFGEPKVNKAASGELGTEYLGTIKIQADPTADDFNTDKTKFDGVFFATAESSNKGLDGLLYKMNFTIPADAKPGDVYPLDILYRSNKNAKDLFTNKENDETGKIMQAYFFTQGIYNSENKYNSTTDPAYVQDVMNGSAYDGYIAIEKPEEETDAPTEAPTEAPTAAPATQAPTEAPTVAPTVAPATQAPTQAPTGGTVAPTQAATGTGTTAAPGTGATTAKPGTTVAPGTTAPASNAPKTGVPGAGMAIAGLAAAIGTAFVLRKREED
jgi:hypothetical protein